jgi:hypothetical protein
MSKKDGPKQKPKPSKEVLKMVRATKANRKKRLREDFSQAAARIVREATENH